MTTPQSAPQRAVHDATFAPFEVKAADAEARTFEGLASTWDLDLGNDVIHRGAFARTIDHWKASGGRRVIPLLDNHAGSMRPQASVRDIIGKMVDARETDDGLWTRYSVARTPAGDDVLTLARDGMLSGLSIGYAVVPGAVEMKGRTRHLKELKLGEVSVVILPMNPGARIHAHTVKSLLAAAREGTLTDEEKSELRALLDEAEQKSAPPALAPDAASALQARLDGVLTRRLATRLDAVLGPARVGRHHTNRTTT